MRKLILGFAGVLLCSSAFPQTHEQTLSTLGIPQPAGTLIGNCTSATAAIGPCTIGAGLSVSGGTISSSGGGSANPAGNSFSVQVNANGALGGTGPGSSGQCLISNGAASSPTFQSCGASGSVNTISAGATNLLSVTGTSAVTIDIGNLGGFTVVGNGASSTAAPTAETMQTLGAAMVSVNETSISASPVAGPTPDYNPAGFGATVAYVSLTPASGNSVLRGLVAGTAMQTVIIANAENIGGTDFIVLNDEDTSDTTAANRFHAVGNIYIPSGGRSICLYSNAISRWTCQ